MRRRCGVGPRSGKGRVVGALICRPRRSSTSSGSPLPVVVAGSDGSDAALAFASSGGRSVGGSLTGGVPRPVHSARGRRGCGAVLYAGVSFDPAPAKLAFPRLRGGGPAGSFALLLRHHARPHSRGGVGEHGGIVGIVPLASGIAELGLSTVAARGPIGASRPLARSTAGSTTLPPTFRSCRSVSARTTSSSAYWVGSTGWRSRGPASSISSPRSAWLPSGSLPVHAAPVDPHQRAVVEQHLVDREPGISPPRSRSRGSGPSTAENAPRAPPTDHPPDRRRRRPRHRSAPVPAP